MWYSPRAALVLSVLSLAGCTSTTDRTNAAEASDPSPVACALSPAQLKELRAQLIPGLMERAAEVTDLDDGLRMRFESRAGLLAELAAVIEQERTCCSFLRFAITVEAGGGSILFEVTGPTGTRELLRSL